LDASRRDILLDAVLLELSRTGYAELSFQGVLADAGVTENEFASEFGEKDVALFAAYRRLSERVVDQAMGSCSEEERWPERIRSGLKAVLDLLATEPDMARVLTRSFPGIRPATYQCYVDLLARFLPAMHAGRDYSGVDEELPGQVELLAVGAAESIIFVEVDAGRAERLPRMLPEILFSILVPFLGPERAAEEMNSAAAAS
jgi:AcrR family transcriptional regulator